MKNLETQQFKQEEPERKKQTYHSLHESSKDEILSGFSESERVEIEKKRKVLSSLAYFIGKDFEIPVELNEPGQGWHWDFKENKIRVDPKDLLEKPMDYLRFVISHEGGHRRISRTEFIPLEEWQQPGFSFMMNSVEDPRDNNFVAENYPKFKEQMALAYEHDLDVEKSTKQKAQKKLGYQPQFMQAGFEYIKQWYRERKDKEFKISEDLPKEVREVVQKTLKSAQDSWWRYPSRQEADDRKKGEENIKKYAKVSYEINRDRIWPEFKKLVEEDMKDQEMQEFMKGMEQEKVDGKTGGKLQQDIKDQLTSKEQKELDEAIEKAIKEAKKQAKEKTGEGAGEAEGAGEGVGGKDGEEEYGTEGKGVPIDLDSLSDELKQKIKDYIDSLPKDKRKELEEKAEKTLGEFSEEIADDIGGKLSDNPEKVAERKGFEEENVEPPKQKEKEEMKPKEESGDLKKYKEFIAETLKKDENIYEEYRREVLPIIDKLETDLREIFVRRRTNAWQTGFRSGKRIDIKKRIQEKAKGIPAMESKAWQKREIPSEKDYAISLLVDLSGSMHGNKIEETFKAVIVLSEVLNRLSISTEILGFNDRIYEYQKYGEQMSKDIRGEMGDILQEVEDFSDTGKAKYNDDGWALEEASERLAKQKAQEKFLIVFSDGEPIESPIHPASKYDLHKIIEEISKNTDQKLVGLGIGTGTKHVENYYPTSIADINVEETAEKLADLLREVIENYDTF